MAAGKAAYRPWAALLPSIQSMHVNTLHMVIFQGKKQQQARSPGP